MKAQTTVLLMMLVALLWCGSAGAGDGVTNYHAWLFGNDDADDENDPEMIKNALLNWDNWVTADENERVTVYPTRSGDFIVTIINFRLASGEVDSDDVLLIYFGGHGGTRADASDGDEQDERNDGSWKDPIRENDNAKDNEGRFKYFDEMVLTRSGDPLEEDASDDELAAALGESWAMTTKVLIMDECYANGNCLGSADPDGLLNLKVLTSTGEGSTQWFDHAWPTSLARVLFDIDGNGLAEADADNNGKIHVSEWYNAASDLYTRETNAMYPNEPGRKSGSCGSFAADANRPIFIGLNNQNTPPQFGGAGDKKQGIDGCGLCSGYDYGDAPDNGMICSGPLRDTTRYYQTTLPNGPRYNEWVSQWLGPVVGDRPPTDSTPDGQPTCNTDGDDDTGNDDEDGVTFDMEGGYLVVTVSVDYPDPLNYRLDAWWDWNDNGVWDADEHEINSLVDYTGPWDCSLGGRLLDLSGTPGEHPIRYSFQCFEHDPRMFFSRFRLTFGVPDTETIEPYGEYLAADGASHGEVEDYGPELVTPAERRSWGEIKAMFR